MTVIKPKSGGSWIHAPIAPTKDFVITNCLFLPMLAPVLYIVLPTLAYEHTNFVGPFSRKFPRAQTWVAPRRWNLSTPWGNEIEQKVVSSLEVGSILPHSNKNIIDTVIFVPTQPPDCISNASLLAAAQNGLVLSISRHIQVGLIVNLQEWPFKRKILAHLCVPVSASRSDFLAAFGFLDELLGTCYVGVFLFLFYSSWEKHQKKFCPMR
ncbi:hypothetical protein MKW92_030023 [Papaver armeniacum]|nr:hypothetical protein MKW92_030023 [Papaver armeniacum]